MTIPEAARLAIAGQLPPGYPALGYLAEAAGTCWNLSGRREAGEFALGIEALGRALNCSAATAGRYLTKLTELNVIRRVKRGSQRRKKVAVYAWVGVRQQQPHGGVR